MAEALVLGRSFEMIYPLKGADGSFRTFLTRIEPVKEYRGRVVRWFGTNTDITDQRRIEQELRRNESRVGRVRLRGQPRFAGTSPHGEYLHAADLENYWHGKPRSECSIRASFVREGVPHGGLDPRIAHVFAAAFMPKTRPSVRRIWAALWPRRCRCSKIAYGSKAGAVIQSLAACVKREAIPPS